MTMYKMGQTETQKNRTNIKEPMQNLNLETEKTLEKQTLVDQLQKKPKVTFTDGLMVI